MSTGFVSPLDLSEDVLDKREQHCKLLDNLSEQLIRSCDIQMKTRKGKTTSVSQNNEMDLKQPRRKDTPALNRPPFLPDFSELLLKKFDEVDKQQKNKLIPSVLNKEQDLRKPRRKDTPALHTSPPLPGIKLLKEDRRAIIVESEETDG
ncbi:protein phosphatase 1 regulatory subunit 17 [Pseudophryne corroboree]|uniref:protein phosphatase 1 regulatory subunit 17 n=1 Tax=Pseudophryne corroboree TaxID=495146 RepID=UPI00308209C4